MKLPRLLLPLFRALGLAAFAAASAGAAKVAPPNIVYILADDMGRGDISAYNPHSAWPTPHIDSLARGGMQFADAHSSSAVCTPSRYSILTGRYAWRSRLKERVAFGYSAPIIEPGRLTVASLLKTHGYTTAMVGKWHLGFDWARSRPSNAPAQLDASDEEPSQRAPENNPAFSRWVDYTKPFRQGPVDDGFDSFFGISASLDMFPYVWLRNDRVVAPPTHEIAGSKLPAMWRAGPIADDFAHIDVLPRITTEAVDFLQRQDGRRPFFLYFALTAPHTPIIPAQDFAGRTHTTPYGDFCVQVDQAVGEVLRVLKERHLEENTLVIFAADNGCSPAANLPQLRTFHHDPQMGLRGAKADIYEGGHRIPFIVRWPGRVAANSHNDALVCQIDFMATCAELLDTPLPANAAEDSVSLLPILTGKSAQVRETLVNHSVNGSFALRQGPWKLCLCPDSGGWSDPKPGKAPPGSPPFQLFNLDQDSAETTNLYAEHPEIVRRLGELLKQQILRGRTTPGPVEQNTGGDDWPQLAWMKQFQ
ncbi:arylsulfatase [Horticoccus luteus]|uniref:Arylsulfatase n=1 Tax=Horticoccus luteus TaxID=2862869 RepID=A0A8F9TSW2_9BACT|nr:arylsulfatase [Horticoccus luteus]QYM78614.1 arylsulfatase [Horticoccus luteus]